MPSEHKIQNSNRLRETMQNHLFWQTRRFQIDLSTPKVMGILNLTPDSFSDGGTYSINLQTALAQAEKLLKEGADILDIGGESTRPGADFVSPEQEWQRIEPILREISQWNIPISLDTRRTSVMRQAIEHDWVDIINDVQALEDDGAVDLLAQSANIGICLMHMQGLPETMQQNPQYADVSGEVIRYLQTRLQACEQAGIVRERITLDPGFGFGKNLQHNIQLMQHLRQIQQQCGLPLLIGVSRKRMIGELTGQAMPRERVSGSVAAALAAVARGAQIIRVHDVAATVDAIKVWQALGGFID